MAVLGTPIEERPLKKNWTVLLVPHDNIKVRNYTLTRPVIILGTVVICATFVFFGILVYGYYRKNISESRMYGLEQENTTLKGKISELGQLTDVLQSRLENIENMEAEYRQIAGLSGIDPDVKKAGVGGPRVSGAVKEERQAIDESYTEKILKREETVETSIRQANIPQQHISEWGQQPT